MNSALSYSDISDQELYLQTTIKLAKKVIKINAATIAGSPEKPNEDAFAAAYDDTVLFAAIFDGTTSLKPIPALDKQTGARFASHFLKNTFHEVKSAASPKELMLELNKKLLQATSKFDGASIEDTHTLPSSTGTIIKIDTTKKTVTFAHVSDSFGIAYYNDGHSVLFTDDRNSAFDDKIFTLIDLIATEKGISHREARDDKRVKKALIHMFIERNNNPNGKGCGVINGDPQVEQYIQTGTFPLQDVKAILLATDGLTPIGWSEKNRKDQQKLFEEVLDGNFKKLLKTKKQSEDADPDWNYIRYKHSDDATGLFIEF